jgi:hypothetical protein
MSDWRENKNGKKEKPKKPTPMPVVPRKPKAESPSSDWRNRAGTPLSGSSTASSSSRNWTKNSGKQSAPELGSLKRATRLAAIGGAIAASIFGFVLYIFSLASPIPVIASVDESESQQTGIAAYADTTRKRFSESSNLFRALSFADRDEDSNYLLRAIMESKSEWLKEIRNNAKSTLAKNYIGPKHLIGGGPNANLVAFYFQGVIARDADGRWQLLAEGANPFDEQGNREGVELAELFRSLAESVAPSSLAFITLDVSPPSVVNNLGDLHFPAQEIEAAWRSIGAELSDRLMVLLPCEDGQENWIAPELSSSVFGHFVFEGLATGFGRRDLTAKTFPTLISDSVRNWVSQNRRAVQQPKILSSLTDDQLDRFKFYRFLTLMPKNTTPVNSSGTMKGRFEELDRYWNMFSKLGAYASVDPVLYGHLESSLVAMENVAESASSVSWGKRTDQFKEDMKRAEANWITTRKVSLMEAAFHQQLNRCNFFTETLLLKDAVPQTLASLTDTKRSADWKSRDDRAMALWQLLEATAASNDATRWNALFTPTALEQALGFVGEPNGGQPEWIEIQLCRTLHREMDPRNADDDCSKAMAKLLHCFSELQRATCTSYRNIPCLPYEKAAWIQDEVFDIDRRFHSAFDAFCANDWRTAVTVLEQVLQPNGPMQALRSKAETLDQSMYARDETLRDVPHLLGLLMRTARYSSMNAEQVKKYAEQLAELLHSAKTTESKLANPRAGAIEEAVWFRSLIPLRSEILRISRPIAQDGAPTHDASIRDYRTALRYPSLELADRKQYHQHIANFYAEEKRLDQTSNALGTESSVIHTPRSVAQHFLAALERFSTNDRDIYQSIATSDLRSSSWPIPKREPASNSKLDMDKRQQTYQLAARIKSYTSSFADKGLSHQDAPWRSPMDFGTLCELEYCDLQMSRLYEARWGNGKFSDNSESLYFRQLAKQYQVPPSDRTASFAANPDVSKRWEQAKRELAAIQVLEEQNDTTSNLDIEMTIRPGEPGWRDAVASVRQWPRQPKTSAVPVVSPLAVAQNARTSIGFDYQATELGYRLSIRGHTFDRPIDRSSERSKITLKFNRSPEKASVKLLATSDPQSVVILLDCSASMTHVNAFAEAKRTVRILLENLKQLSELGVPSEVSLIAFGLKLAPSSQLPPGFVFAKAKGKLLNAVVSPVDEAITPSAVIQTEKFVKTTSDEFDRLFDLVQHESIRAEGATPLYNAMMAGTEMLLQRQNKGRKLIVVSDGANDVASYEEIIKNKGGYVSSFRELEEKVREYDLSLYFFQFDNEGFYRDRGYTPAELAPLQEANRELFGLVNSKMGSMQRPFSDFATLQKALTDSFSLPKVSLTYDGQSQSMPLEFAKTTTGLAPGWCQIAVQAPADKSDKLVDTELTTRLKITGNERFELHYSDQLRSLKVIPYPFPTPSGVQLRSKEGTDANARDRLYAVHERNEGIRFRIDRQTEVPWRTGGGSLSYAYVPRPSFVVASITASPENPNRNRFIVSDVGYAPAYPPQMTLPPLPLDVNQDRKVQLDVWYADELPETYMESIELRDGDTVSAKTGGATLKRTADQVTVQLTPNQENRVFVLCPAARSTNRDFYAASRTRPSEERHSLQLEGAAEKLQIRLIDEMRLRKAVEDGSVEHRWSIYTLAK